MTEQELKFIAEQNLIKLLDNVLRVIEQFPKDSWNERHILLAIKILVENPEKTPEKVIDNIKRSWLCFGEDWFVDGGKKYIPLTQEEKDFNLEVKERLKV